MEREILLSSYADVPEVFVPETWGAHHASLHPDGKSIYIGSYEGTMFVIDKDSLELQDTFNTGLGLGHVAFVPERNMAITTNHYAPFKTIVDVSDPKNNRIIKNLNVAKADTGNTGKRLQSHTSHTDPDEQYFYSVSSLDGKFYAIDLDRLEVVGSVTMSGAYPLMGALVSDTERGKGGHRHLNHL
jgi:DNA-binding beta-propeller fold protein YncE